MLNFFKKLLPNVEKRRILNQCDRLTQNFNDILLPSLTQVMDAFTELGIRTTASKRAQLFEKDVKTGNVKYFKSHQLVNYGTIINGVTENAVRKLGILRSYVEKYFVENLATNAMTYKQLHVVRMLDLMNFFFEYSMKFLHQVNYEECIAADIKPTEKPLVDNQVKWLDVNYRTYLQLCSIMAEKEVDFEKFIKSTSDLIISESEENATLLGASTDPHRLGFMPIIGDLILLVREHGVVRENEKYEANKLRLQTLQLQLQALKMKAQDGQYSTSLLQQIDYQTSRIRDLEYKVRQHEVKVGIADAI